MRIHARLFTPLCGIVVCSGYCHAQWKATVLNLPTGTTFGRIQGFQNGNLLVNVINADGSGHVYLTSESGNYGVDINPSGVDANTSDADGSLIAGFQHSDNHPHAAVWTSPSASSFEVIDTTDASSATTHISGNLVSGWTSGNGAVYWTVNSNGSATKTVLARGDYANGIDSQFAVGSGGNDAKFWNLANPSQDYILTGANENWAQAWDVLGNVAVGVVTTENNIAVYQNAYAWKLCADGTSISNDINPANFSSSFADGINGGWIVGYGNNALLNNRTDAVVWTSASASSAVDLGALLPSGYQSSTAYGSDAGGNLVYGSAYTNSGEFVPVVWQFQAAPETGSLWSVGIGIGLLAMKRRRS